MKSSRTRAQTVKVPWELHKALLSLQVEHDLGFEEACTKAAELIASSGEAFNKSVKREARKLAKGQFMSQLNTARKSIRNKAYREGVEWTRKNEDNFRVPCSICGKDMYFSNRDQNWDKTKADIHETFTNWSHTECRK